MSESDELELKRLRWRCRRGMRELDRLFERYLDQGWGSASDFERGVFRQLLEVEDVKLWRWFMGHDVPDAAFAPMVERIRSLPP